MNARVAPKEALEQKWLFEWAGAMSVLRYPELALLYHCPNGGSRNAVEARHLKEQGVKAGIPDIFLPVAKNGWHGLYIELKRKVGGVVSPEQKQMIDKLRMQKYRVEVCTGIHAAADVIEAYMEGRL